MVDRMWLLDTEWWSGTFLVCAPVEICELVHRFVWNPAYMNRVIRVTLAWPESTKVVDFRLPHEDLDSDDDDCDSSYSDDTKNFVSAAESELCCFIERDALHPRDLSHFDNLYMCLNTDFIPKNFYVSQRHWDLGYAQSQEEDWRTLQLMISEMWFLAWLVTCDGRYSWETETDSADDSTGFWCHQTVFEEFFGEYV